MNDRIEDDMTKDVLIAISGLQFETQDDEAVEIITAGEYYCKGDKHYVLYEEIISEDHAVTKNTLKISDNQIDILRKGAVSVHMTFEENKNNITYYNTPFGQMLIGIDTYRIKKKIEENQIEINIQYGLEINYAHVSDCEITIHIKPRQGESFESINL